MNIEFSDMLYHKGHIVQIEKIANPVGCFGHRRWSIHRNKCILLNRLSRSSGLLYRFLVGEIAIHAEVALFRLIINSCTIVMEAVYFHCAFNIALRGLLSGFYRLIVHLCIEAVLEMVVCHYQVGRSHPVGIAVDLSFCQPLRLIRERSIDFSHLLNMGMHSARPEIAFMTLTCTKEVVTVCTKTIQQTIICSAVCWFC